MRRREQVRALLKLGYDALMTDIDVGWLKNPTPYLYCTGVRIPPLPSPGGMSPVCLHEHSPSQAYASSVEWHPLSSGDCTRLAHWLTQPRRRTHTGAAAGGRRLCVHGARGRGGV